MRLPKDIAFAPDTEVMIVCSGDVLTIFLAALSVPDMLSRLAQMPAPPSIEVRDEDELPEPSGL